MNARDAGRGSPGAVPRPDAGDWMELRRDAETGIETIRAHFTGHAYEPHDHDDVLVGVTEQGLQQFRCRRALHTSTPGRAILIEPGEVHDGRSAGAQGFTYAMLYLPYPAVAARLAAPEGHRHGFGFPSTLHDDPALCVAIRAAFLALHRREGRLARDVALERLYAQLLGHVVAPIEKGGGAARAALRAREVLHARLADDLGLEELAAASGTDRFRLNRVFREAFGLSPHGYLVRLRLRAARRLLATGAAPGEVAAAVGFADQSHLGRWFRRAYGLTPGAYARICTDVPDRAVTAPQARTREGPPCSIPKSR